MRLSTGADTETILKWATALVTLAGFFWGVDATLKTRALDARRPFLDMQLKLYEETTKTASVLVSSEDLAELKAAEVRFWQLYWGQLAMVENGGSLAADGGVEAAMVQFGAVLQTHPKDRSELQQLSLRLAHACRDSLAESWGVRDWRTPRARR